MKKRMIALMLALVMLLTAGCAALASETDFQSPATEGKNQESASKPLEDGNTADGGFTDVPENSFYFDAVNWAVENGISNGLTDTTFGPDAQCNRAQVVTFLWRLAGKPTVSGENVFTDVADGSWYADAVLWAVEQDVTNGMAEGVFQPDGVCNRAQIVTFLWKYAGKPSAENGTLFDDVPEGDWYAEAVAWAVENGITNGLTETTFGPQEPCNRAQIVTFLYRYVTGLEDVPEETLPTEPVETEPKETEPEETEPKETEPKETEPKETEPKETEPKETEPKETEPKETEPPETEPTEPEPTEDPNMGEWA